MFILSSTQIYVLVNIAIFYYHFVLNLDRMEIEIIINRFNSSLFSLESLTFIIFGSFITNTSMFLGFLTFQF